MKACSRLVHLKLQSLLNTLKLFKKHGIPCNWMTPHTRPNTFQVPGQGLQDQQQHPTTTHHAATQPSEQAAGL